eukprot:TRINITY_DN11665_c0_g1_i1.p1 TRINITY_DN11665_c0_g1~~TRINITY_DN11665_c0_g1_i1.p1  ORF type:complete len:378 (-),score=75.85 TRINITY_DN11665_c0_g1_i1:122-1255(-)
MSYSMEYNYEPQQLDYANKVVLAPMVRVGTLPMRLTALKYGADIVYSEELIALKLRKMKRVYNKQLKTVDFVDPSEKDPKPMFRTCVLDHPNVLQLGVAEAVTALEAATVVSRDVDGIDLNMGCPKHFSVHAGMGSALLCKPEVATDILSTLKRNLPNPITAKIRLRDTVAETVDLLRRIEQTGVSAIAVHARFVPERPRDPAHWDLMREIIEVGQSAINVPLIVNGDVFKHEDIAKVKQLTGASSVMIARGAISNTSIFRPEAAPLDDVIRDYLRACVTHGTGHGNAKYTLQQILRDRKPKHRNDQVTHHAKSLETLCEAWDLQDFFRDATRPNAKRDHAAAFDDAGANSGHSGAPILDRLEATGEVSVKTDAHAS